MKLRAIVLSAAVLLAVVAGGLSSAAADPASELAAAEESVASATARLAAAEQSVSQATEAFAPIKKEVNSAVAAAKGQLEQAEALKHEVVAERRGAAEEVEAAESDYEDEKSTHNTTTAVGIGLAIAVVLAAIGAALFAKFRKWPLKKNPTRAIAGVLSLLFLGGLALALIPSEPEAPEFSANVEKLASAYEGNPLRPPTPDMVKEFLAVKPLLAKAKELKKAAEPSVNRLAEAESEASEAQKELTSAKSEMKTVGRVVAREERVAAEESNFKEEATSIDYNQLIKNADAYKGEKVVYTGQVFQIQESGGGGIILLAVTDEGYGFWGDNIWVDYSENLEATEEDIITVYGTISGSKEYETQAGGSTYVPRMTAKYIEE